MRRFFIGFAHAIRGIKVAVKEQLNLKVQLVITIIVTIAGFYFGITPLEWIVICLTIGLVIGLELINTAIENLVDLVTAERIPLAGKVKDMAAGAVLIAAVIAVIVGWLIFEPYVAGKF